ncbi:MAG: TonB-dependent receptor [Flavobacteriales bacterium]
MKHRLACVLLYLLSSLGYAQNDCQWTVSGRVVDEHDGSALSFADVFIEGTETGTISDENGNYRLENVCSGTWIVVCAHLGCEPIRDTLIVDSNLVHDFFPEHHAELLEAVSIEEKKRDENPVTLMTTISNFELISGQSLGKSLERVTGVYSLNTGGSISKPIIHGLHSNRLLMINNGVRQEGQQWGNEHAPEIDPAIAGELQVIKGASSVQYGSDAIAGVVLVNPRPLPDSVGIGGLAQLTGESNGRGGTAAGSLEGRHERFSALRWRTQGSVKKLGNQQTPDYFLKNTGVEEWNFSGAASLSDHRKGLEVFYSQFNTNLGIFSATHIGNLTDLQRAFESPVPLETSGFSYDIGRPYQHVEHELTKISGFVKPNDNSQLKLTYGRQYNLREEYDKHRGADSTLPGLQFEIVTHTADLVYETRKPGRNLFRLGLSSLVQENTYEGRFFIPNFHKWSGGAFLIDQFTLSSGWIFEAGARLDMMLQRVYFDESGAVRNIDHGYAQPTFSLGANKLFSENWQWKGNIATAWRPPNVNELYSNGLHHGAATYEIGDSNLKAEVSYSAASSLGYEGQKLVFELEGYCNFMNGFIYLVPQFPATLTIRGAFPTYAYQQTDALLCGVDSRVSYQFANSITVESKTSILRARNLALGAWLAQMPADQTSLSLKYERERKRLRFFVKPAMQWVNKQWRVPPSSDYVAPPNGYVLAHFMTGISKTNRKRETHFNIEINNLINQRYRSYLNRYRYFADEVGRNIIVRFTQHF